MSLLTVQRSPTPSESSEKSENVSLFELSGDVSANRSSSASTSEDFVAVTGAAIALPSNARRQSLQEPPVGLQDDMHRILNKLRPNDSLKLVVKLEEMNDLPMDRYHRRYFCLVSCVGILGTEESVILGFDLTQNATSIGLVIPIMLDMTFNLHGEGGFKVIVKRDHDYLFKPISVQALWTALQALTLAQKAASENNYFANGPSHTWVSYYNANLTSTRLQINEWGRTDDTEDDKGFTPPQFPEENDNRRRFENKIRKNLREVMIAEDLEVVTVAQLRRRLGEVMNVDLTPYKNFIGESVIFIFGQLESPSQIFDHVYLGSKWNACNLEELQEKGVGYIINITKEIDNFFPDVFTYYNVRLLDEEKSDLMSHWEETHRFINMALENNSRVLVHCKMGMSRSASTVMAYAMKEYNWSYDTAHKHVKECRQCICPNNGFIQQLKTYEGILTAKSNRQKFDEQQTRDAIGASALPSRRHQNPSGEARMSESSDIDQPINIEQDILQYKQQPLSEGKDFQSVSDSAETSGDSMAPSNPSIAPDPMEETPAEGGAGACGGFVRDPRTSDLRSVRDDLYVQKDRTEAPWRRSLRAPRNFHPESLEKVSEARPADTMNSPMDEVAGLNSNFRPDSSWIKPRSYSDPSFDMAVDHPHPEVLVLPLKGDIPGEEISTDPPRLSSGESVGSSSEEETDVVMRDNLSDSLPPCGTVKRQSDRLENLRELSGSQGASDVVSNPHAEVVRSSSQPVESTVSVYNLEDIQLEPGIVKKTKQTIEARQRTSGEYSSTGCLTPNRLSVGENNSARYLSGGAQSPIVPTAPPAAAGTPRAPYSQILSDGDRLLGESSSDIDLAQVRRKMLLMIRQVGDALATSRTPREGSCVLNVVREVESSVDHEPIPPVRHLVEVFRGASGVLSSG